MFQPSFPPLPFRDPSRPLHSTTGAFLFADQRYFGRAKRRFSLLFPFFLSFPLSLFSLSLFVFSFSFFSRCFFLSPMKRGCFPPRHRAAGNGSWTRMKTFHGRWLIVDIVRRVFLVSSFQRNSLPPPKFFRIMMFAR